MKTQYNKSSIDHNHLATALEGGLCIGGSMFLAAGTVLPTAIQALGGSVWLIALAPALLRIGFLLPPLFTAHYVERLQRVKPFVMLIGFIQRLPYPLCALYLFVCADRFPEFTPYIVALTPLLFGLLGGLSQGALLELFARVVPIRRRASIWAFRNLVVAVFGLGAGCVVSHVLVRYPGAVGYGILHLLVTTTLFASYVALAFIKEKPVQHIQAEKHFGLLENLRQITAILRQDQVYRKYLASRVTGLSIFVVLPILPLHACGLTGSTAGAVGLLLTAQMVGVVAANLVAGRLGDQFGGRLLLKLSRGLTVGALVVAISSTRFELFMLAYACLGAAAALDQVGMNTLCTELFPVDRRPTYYSLQQFLILPGLLITSGLSALLMQRTGLFPAAIVALVGTVVSACLLLHVPEPRHAHRLSPIQS